MQLLVNNQAQTVSQYRFVAAAANTSAQSILQSSFTNGWRLVVINDQEEQDYLAKELSARYPNATAADNFLTGARQNATGGWVWADNSMLNYTAWWFGQPAATNAQAVGAMKSNQNWRWSAIAQTQTITGYILEKTGVEIDPAVLATVGANNFEFVVRHNSLPAGPTPLTLQARDAAGRVGSATVTVRKVVNTAPVITLVSPDFSQVQTQAITLQGYVSFYGLTQFKDMSWSLAVPVANFGGAITPNASGNFSLALPSTNLAATGNVLTLTAVNNLDQPDTEQITFGFLPTAPALTLTLKDGAALTQAELTGTITLPAQQTARIELIINNTAAKVLAQAQPNGPFALPFAISGLTAGNNTLIVRATSNLGAVTTQTLQQITVARPVVTISSPTINQLVNGPVQVVGSVSSVFPLSSIALTLDNATAPNLVNTATSPNFDFTIPASALTAGTHSVTVTALASAATTAAFSGSQTRSFTYEQGPITLISPVHLSTYSGFVQVQGSFDIGTRSLKALDMWVNGDVTSLLQNIKGTQFSYSLSPAQLVAGANSLVISLTDGEAKTSAVKVNFTYNKPSVASMLIAPAQASNQYGDVTVTGKIYSEEKLTQAQLIINNQITKNLLPIIDTDGNFSIVLKPAEMLGKLNPNPNGNSVDLVLNASSSTGESQDQRTFTFYQNAGWIAGGDVVVINDGDPLAFGLGTPENKKFALNLVEFDNANYPRAKGTQIVFDAEYGFYYGYYSDLQTWYEENKWSITKFETITTSAPVTTAFYKSIPANVKVIFLWGPRQAFSPTKVAALKQFAAEGGRIVFVGEIPGTYTGIAVENDLLKQLGVGISVSDIKSEISSIGGARPVSTTPHQITAGVSRLLVNGPQVLNISNSDIALMYDAGNVIIAAGRVDIN